MDCIKDNSLVNKLMFAPPTSSYTKDLGVFWIEDITKSWIENVCCLFIKYERGRATILTSGATLETHPVIIVCHGNACDIGHMEDFGKTLCQSCACHVVLYEYPGYGLSIGSPSENSCMNGLINVIDHLNQQMAIPIQNMIFYGQSIGSGIAAFGYKYCKITFKQSPAGLVLISPYLSIKTLGKDILSTSYVPILDRLDTRENIKYCDTGLLIMHGDQDEVIPVNHGKELYDIAKCPVKTLDIIENVGHDYIDSNRIINNCLSTLQRVSSHILSENVSYENNICWNDKSNHKQPGSSVIATSVATSLEATSACSNDTSSCIVF